MAWSLLAIRRRRLLPGRPPGRAMALAAVALLGYWGARLGMERILGWSSFPAV